MPVPLKHSRRRRECDDWNIVCTKLAVRDLINRELPRSEQYHGLHATDTTDQAWRVVRLVAPSEEDNLRARIDEMRLTSSAIPIVEASNDWAIPQGSFAEPDQAAKAG
jgi:hypothetical protein